jgi:hypothetical protein
VTKLLRQDAAVIIYQWQRQIGDHWSCIALPPTGNGHNRPLHPKAWTEHTASGEAWQRHGIHGFLDKDKAFAAMPLVTAFIRTEAEYPQYRLAQLQLTQVTTALVTATVKDLTP